MVTLTPLEIEKLNEYCQRRPYMAREGYTLVVWPDPDNGGNLLRVLNEYRNAIWSGPIMGLR